MGGLGDNPARSLIEGNTMRIGTLVGKTDKGGFEYIGQPGEISALDANMAEIITAGGSVKDGKKETRFVKLWLSDASRLPLKAKNC